MRTTFAGLVLLLCLSHVASADPESLNVAEQVLRQADPEGRGPDLADFVTLVNREDIRLDRMEFDELHRLLASLQMPEVSREQLAIRIAAKRRKISSYVAHLSSEEVGTIDPQIGRLYQRYELTRDGKKFLSRTWNVGADGQSTLMYSISFDGEVVREYKDVSNQGVIRQLRPEDRYTLVKPGENPIATSLLLDSKALLGEFHPDADLAGLLESDSTIVFGDQQKLDATSCVVASNLSTVVYLDPENDFRVLRRESWQVRFGTGARLEKSDWVTTYTDFRETDVGFKLPRRVARQNTSDGRRNVVTVDNLVINGEVDASLFDTDVIPAGVETFDLRDQ
jgi:hypothetical protein